MILPFLHLFGFLSCVFLAVFVFYKDTKSILNWTCSILMLCFALWNFGDIIIQNPDRSITKGTVVIMQNIASIGWLGFASALLCFSLAFSKREKLLKKKWFLFFVFIVPLFFIYKQWTNCITINSIRQSYGWLYFWADTIWTYLFYVYYSLFTLLSIYFIYSYGRKTKNINKKKQAKIITLSVIASLISGTIFEVVILELGIYNIPTLGNLFIFAVGLFYAIVKYRFLIITPAIAAENIIAAMDEFLILLNQEGNIITVNKITLDSLQYEQKELEGKSVTILFRDDSLKSSLLERITKGEIIKNHESDFLTKNGKQVPIIYSSSPLINEERIVIGTVFIARDITERKQIEEELIIANKELAFQNSEKEKRAVELIIADEAISQSEKNFRRSISESPLGIRIVSLDGETVYANKAFLDIFELKSMEEFTSIPAINRYTPESYAQHQERKEKRKNGHNVLDYEISIVCANTGIRHIKIWRREVIWNGTKHYQVINLNITERKKLTTDLIAAKEKAEESDRLKSSFLAAISHELRTPLNAIIGFSGFLDRNLPKDDIVEFGKIINSSGNHLLSIVNDIFDITLIETGKAKITKEKINLNNIFYDVENIIHDEQRRMDKTEIELKLIPSSREEDIFIYTDLPKLKQILINLLKNALKFTEKGHVHYGYSVEDVEGKPVLQFYVKDTGIGIPKDKQGIIFEMFRQAEETFSRNYGGTGIGLSVCKKLAVFLGGKIWVESEEGVGSTFNFTIPFETPEEVSKPVKKETARKNNLEGKTILVVEDDKPSYKLLKIILESSGINTIWAKDGEESIKLYKENSGIDMVLMNINMPKLNGYDATKEIKKFRPTLPIIAQTAYAVAGDREESFKAGCDDYISKPVKKEVLMELIKKYLKTRENEIE